MRVYTIQLTWFTKTPTGLIKMNETTCRDIRASNTRDARSQALKTLGTIPENYSVQFNSVWYD